MTKEAIESLIGRLEVWALFFGVIVAVGVAGESVYGVRIWWNSRKLHDIERAENAALLLKVAQANDRATQAESHLADAKASSDSAETHAKEADARAAVARKEAEGFQAQIAQSNERAAEAKKEAESEHLARVKLEEKMAWRTLNDEQQKRIADKLKPFSGTPFEFSTNPEPEAVNFLGLLEAMLTLAHWSEQPFKGTGTFAEITVTTPNGNTSGLEYASGILIEVPPEKLTEWGAAANALASALLAEDIYAKFGPNPALAKHTAIRVVSGKKP